ncbi:MAG: nitroreductase family protein [Gemmatimonadota bacterium]|nr:nitroreductase family protein [Gemmatimonadota bacterium]
MTQGQFIPLTGYTEYAEAEMTRRAKRFHELMQGRRSVRQFSDRPVPPAVIELCLQTAGSAPSGANRQPWHFVAVSDPAVKRRIREAAEQEEREFYDHRAPPEWLAALAPLGTDAEKAFLETAPVLIAIFAERYHEGPDGTRQPNYYVSESVGIATGLLITALHQVGLASLTHTPSPMGFLNEILGRPERDRPFLLLVVGYPAPGAVVPAITRKPLDVIATFL